MCHEQLNGAEMGEIFNEGRENVHDVPLSGRPSVVNEDLVRAVEEKIQENRLLTILSLSLHFSQIAQSLLRSIVSDKLHFWKLCKRCLQKNTMKWQASALTFVTRYSEQGSDFLSRIVTENEAWVSYLTPGLKQQSMEWRHTSSPIKKEFRPFQLARLCAQCFGTENAF
jgi:hypothetical protein